MENTLTVIPQPAEEGQFSRKPSQQQQQQQQPPEPSSSSSPPAAQVPSSKPPSNPVVAATTVVDSLPPEAIDLATRMFNAARNGEVEVLEQALARGLPSNLTNEKGDSLIMLAAYHGHSSLVHLLLSHNADPNRLNLRQQSPLAGAIFKNEREIVKILVQEGKADPDLGMPSAREAMKVFKKEEVYGGLITSKEDEA